MKEIPTIPSYPVPRMAMLQAEYNNEVRRWAVELNATIDALNSVLIEMQESSRSAHG